MTDRLAGGIDCRVAVGVDCRVAGGVDCRVAGGVDCRVAVGVDCRVAVAVDGMRVVESRWVVVSSQCLDLSQQLHLRDKSL